MFRLMEVNKSMAVCIGLIASTVMTVFASPEDDQITAYLKDQGMWSLLEVQLEDRIKNAGADERDALLEELSNMYLSMLRSVALDDPQRELLVFRATELIERLGQSGLYELRLELIINQYVSLEPEVELTQLGLQNSADHTDVVDQMKQLDLSISLLLSQLSPELDRLDRKVNRPVANNSDDSMSQRKKHARMQSFFSLGNYYKGWIGYSLAVLQMQHVPNDVFRSFGWLLGSEGELPIHSNLNESTFEFDHVARSALGLALCYAQADQPDLAKKWISSVADSMYTSDEVKRAAQSRWLQILAEAKNWQDLNAQHNIFVSIDPEFQLTIADARFIAIQALESFGRNDSRNQNTLHRCVEFALSALLENKEIGHIVDLYQRYQDIPALPKSFVYEYAKALAELRVIESSSRDTGYSAVALRLRNALKHSDADDFPTEQEDCKLKLAFCELRLNRARESISLCEDVIESSTSESSIEEARWIRIAAYSIAASNNPNTNEKLDEVVREYIVAYPNSPKSAKLVLRYAAGGTIDSDLAVQSLRQIDESDEIVIPARRALIGVLYQQSQAAGHGDQVLVQEILDLIQWVHSHQSLEYDTAEISSRFAMTRIGLDLLSRQQSSNKELMKALLSDAESMIQADRSLASYQSEIQYRTMQIAIEEQEFDRAVGIVEQMRVTNIGRADSALSLLYSKIVAAWNQNDSERRILSRLLIKLGPSVAAIHTPPYPQAVGPIASQAAEYTARSVIELGLLQGENEESLLALRLAKVASERGNPTATALRAYTQVAAAHQDHDFEKEVWLTLLSFYKPGESQWFEARYHSIRVIHEIDPVRARTIYNQFEILYPSRGPEPWASQYREIVGELVESSEVKP